MLRKLFVLLVFVSVCFGSVSAADVELCGESACGSNEVCDYDIEQGEYCACVKGTTLIDNACVDDICAKNKCPENSFCSAEFGYAECRCKDGFFLDKFRGKETCVSEDVKNYNEIVLLNELECTQKGICDFKFDLQYPENAIDVDALNKQSITIRTIEDDYEGELFSGSLDKCLKDGFCKDISANTIAFGSIFPVSGKKEIAVDYYGANKGIVNESLPFVVENVAEPCDLVSCTYGTYCVNRDTEAFCKNDNDKDKDSLAYLMNQANPSIEGGVTTLRGVVTSPEEQFFYHLSDTSPGTSSCQTVPSYLGSFCGESFPIIFGQPRGVLIPDVNPVGISRTTSASNFDYMLSSVTVYANITHTYIGDLVITIVSPNGTEKIVHNRAGGSTDNLTLSISVTDFNGENPEGTWTLRVQDLASGDEGRLTQWGIKLNSSGDRRIRDYSANKRHGAYNGSLHETGVIAGAIGFDGTNDRITAFGTHKPSESLTFTGWAYPDTFVGDTKQLMHARKSDTERIRVMMYSGKVRAYVNGSYMISTGSVSTGTWTHVAVSFDTVYSGSTATGTNVKIYINNELDKTGYFSGQVIDTTYYYYWTFGAYRNSASHSLFFDGKLDEFRIYDSVLSRYQRDLVYDYGCSSGYYRRNNKTCYNTDSCGDGRWTGSEECEDKSTEGCNVYCQQDDGYYFDWCLNGCEDVYYTVNTQCGDNYQAGDEDCDDGNTVVETCPTYGQSCSVCGETCEYVSGVVEECGDGIVQTSYEECDTVSNCTNCECDSGYYSVESLMVPGHYSCVSVCEGVDCGTTGTCNNSTGQPVCQCGYGYVARNNYCVEGWFEDTNMAAAVVDLLQSKGLAVEDELDIDPSYMFDDIEYLNLSGKSIESIVGLELFPSLKELDLSDNNITNLHPLGQKYSLVYLSVAKNPVSDASIIGTLHISGLDISNTAVYDYSPLKNVSNLSMVTISNESYASETIFRPDNLTVPDWIYSWFGTDCVRLIEFEMPAEGFWRRTEENSQCSSNGTCISGVCVCDSGYENVNGDCLPEGPTCPTGFHLNSNVCVPDMNSYPCNLPQGTTLVVGSNTVQWDPVTHWGIPTGKNAIPCHFENNNCNNDSLCLYECGDNHKKNSNYECVSEAYRDISSYEYNSLGFPTIVRQDVPVEPVKGLPNFNPTLRLKMWHDFSNENNALTKEMKGGWFLDLPRVELNSVYISTVLGGNYGKNSGWDGKYIYVHMPWGKEEYSLAFDEKCYDSLDTNFTTPLSSCSNLEEEDWVEVKYFPSPGQMNFSYIILRARYAAAKIKYSGGYYHNYYVQNNISLDHWIVERIGGDGSTTKFERTKARPGLLNMMDYIPISEYSTRDGSLTQFFYQWSEENKKTTSADYSHMKLEKLEIVDPIKRMIIVESGTNSWNGLMGEPDEKSLHTPIHSNVSIKTALADSNNQMISGSDKLRVEYVEGNYDESRDVKIYKDGALYREDQYYWYDENILVLKSLEGSTVLGETRWTFKSLLEDSNGYNERKKVSSSPAEWIEEDVHTGFHEGEAGYNKDRYPNSYKFFSTANSVSRKIVYSLIDSIGLRTMIRRKDELYSNWLQIKEEKVCKTESIASDNCDVNNESVVKIGYDVYGNIVYKKDIDGSSSLLAYHTNFVGPDDYIGHFRDGSLLEKAQLRKAGKVFCSADYSRVPDSNIESNYLLYATGEGINLTYWCDNSSNRRATEYTYDKGNTATTLDEVWDLTEVEFPNGVGNGYQVDHSIGKIVESTVTGTTETLKDTCYNYNTNGSLLSQGIMNGSSCDYKKGFSFINNYLMVSDYSLSNGTPSYNKYYFFDKLGRKVAETNSANVTTLYHYDDLNRVVETRFGCFKTERPAHLTLYDPEIIGQTSDDDFPFELYSCEYSRIYEYDKMCNLTNVYFTEKYNVTSTPSIQYNAANEITRVTQTTDYNLVGWPEINCQEDAEQEISKCIHAEHDIFGNIIKKTFADSNDLASATFTSSTEVAYDYLNRPLSIEKDGLRLKEFEYSFSHLPSTNYYGYKKIKNKYDKVLEQKYDAWGRTSNVLDPFGNSIDSSFDDLNYRDVLISTISSDSNSQEFKNVAWTYDDLGRKLSEINKQFVPGDTTIINHEINWAYDQLGNVKTQEFDGQNLIEYDYDDFNREWTVTYNEDNDGNGYSPTSTVTNSYDVSGRLNKLEVSVNNKVITEEYEFDVFGRKNKICKKNDFSGSSDVRCRYKLYNSNGKLIWEADEEVDGAIDDSLTVSGETIFGNIDMGNEKYYIYNDFGDIKKEIYVMTNTGLGGDSADPNDWLNNGLVTNEYGYDSFGRLAYRMNDRGSENSGVYGGTTFYSYYSSNVTGEKRKNRLESIETLPALNDGDLDFQDTESKKQKYVFEYDSFGERVGTEYFEENSSGVYSSVVKLTLGRDAFGRIDSRSTDGAVNPVTQTFTYDARNLLESATEGDIVVSRLYDSFDKLYHETISIDPANTTDDKVVIRKHVSNNKIEMTYPDSKVLEMFYTGQLLDEVKYNNTSIVTYTRGNGVLSSIDKGVSIDETFHYNHWNLLESHTINNGSEDIYDTDYEYTEAWHLSKKTNVKNSGKADAYKYDSYYRLNQVEYDVINGTPDRIDTFILDGVNNIEQSTENGVDFDWGVDKLNRLIEKEINNVAEVTYSYDEKNNMIFEDQAGGRDYKYEYDDLNRLIEIKRYNGSQWWKYLEFTYDAFNRRVKKVEYGTDGNPDYTFRYSYNGWNIVEIEKKIHGWWTVTYHRNVIDEAMDKHLAIEVTEGFPTQTSTLYYFITDDRNNVVALSDSSGNILERYRYRVYGDFEVLNNNFTLKDCNQTTCYVEDKHNFLWGGSLHEPETVSYDSNGDPIPESGLYWMRNRYYHKGMHRFINQDPIGIWGDANNLGNGFAYVAGMVTEKVDPAGLNSLEKQKNETDEEFQKRLNNGRQVISKAIDIFNKQFFWDPVTGLTKAGEDYLRGFVGLGLTTKFKNFLEKLDPESAAEAWYAIYSLLRKGGALAVVKAILDGLSNVKRIQRDGKLVKVEDTDGSTRWYDGDGYVYKYENGKWYKKRAGFVGWLLDDWEEIDYDPRHAIGYPLDPYSDADKIQQKLLEEALKEMIEMKTKKNKRSLEDLGPVIKFNNGNAQKIFIFNPYYRGKDPMKEVIWKIKNDSGLNGFIRNPFAPGGEYEDDKTTYEKFQIKGFFQPEVDPYWK